MTRAVVVSMAVAWLVLGGTAGAQATVTVGTKQSVDITITRYVVDANGERIGLPAQTIRYRLSRARTDAGWKTTMSLGAPDGATREQIARTPFFGGRVEFDEVGRFSMFDNAGNAVDIPTRRQPAVEPALAQDWSGWLEAVSNRPDRKKERIRAIEATFGSSGGAVRGLSRYTRESGGHVEELLVDDRSAVPVELNVARDGALMSHLSFDYSEDPGGGLLRRRVRSQVVMNAEGHRVVTVTELSNLVREQ